MWLVLSLALLVALAASAHRYLRARRLRRERDREPGANADNPIPVTSYREIDDHLVSRRCPCGGKYKSLGEATAEQDGTSIRIVRVECGRCEELGWIYFDTSDVKPPPTLH